MGLAQYPALEVVTGAQSTARMDDAREEPDGRKRAEQDKRGRHVRAVRACLHISFFGTRFFWSVPSNT
jgi:hypothetical protein